MKKLNYLQRARRYAGVGMLMYGVMAWVAGGLTVTIVANYNLKLFIFLNRTPHQTAFSLFVSLVIIALISFVWGRNIRSFQIAYFTGAIKYNNSEAEKYKFIDRPKSRKHTECAIQLQSVLTENYAT